MLKSKITRREFLKGSVSLAAAATALSFLELTSKKVNADEIYEPGWNIEWRPNMCAFCANVCGEVIRVHKKGNLKRPLKLEGNKNDNYNQGKLCARGQAGLKYLFNPDRITEPLIRIPGSKRGEWKFKKASWQEAYGYIMQKMMEANIQPHEIMFLGGWHGCAQYRPIMFPALAAFKTFNVWGSPIQNCVGIEHIGIHATFGYFNTHDEMVVDFPHVNFILIVRNNASLTGISTGRAHRFGLALKNGAEVYVVDVRRSEAAARATKWLRIKPGTDNAFALALLHVVLHEEYYGKKLYEHNIDFLKYHTNAPFLVVKMKHPITKQETWWLLSEKVDQNGNPNPMGLWYKNFYVWNTRTNNIAELKGYTNSNKEDVNGNPVDPALELPEEVRKGLLENLRKQNPAIEDVKTVWELLKEKTKPYTPEWAEKITEIPAEDIRETAIKFATKRPSVIEPGIYDARYANTVQLRKTLALLQAIVNGHDNIGGYIVGGEYRHKVAKFAEWMRKNNRTFLTLPINDYPPMQLPGMIFMMQIFFGILMPNAQNPKAVMAYLQKGDYSELAKCAFGYPTVEVQKSLEQWLKFMRNPKKEQPGVAFPAFGDYGWDDAFEGKMKIDGKPYRPKAIFGYAINPVLGSPYGDKWKEWMQKADLVVYIDTMPTDSNAYADVILPDLSFLERKEILGKGNSHHLSVIERLPAVDKPIGNSKHALDIFFDMIASMVGAQILMKKYGIDISTPEGKQKAMQAMQNPQMMRQAYMEGAKYYLKLIADMNGWDYKEFSQKVFKALSERKPFTEGLYEYTLEEVAKEAGKPVEEVKKELDEKGVYNIEELEELIEKWAIPEKIPTSLPSGRVELYSTLFEMAQAFYGYLPNWDPLCTYVPVRRKESGLAPDEFFVAHGKAPIFSHTGIHTLDNPLLVGISEWKKLPEIYYHIWMHPKAAERLGIKNGDLVEIYNSEAPDKKTKAYVWVTEWVREDTIFIPFNGGTEAPKLHYAVRPPKAVRHVDILEYKVEPVIAGYTKDETTIRVRKVS
jgi:anaerobic selenocysteine-containing dehydrogenase